jgi:hypothetical protein
VARKNYLERQEPRKKPREEPGFEGWPVLFWLCRVVIRVHGHLQPDCSSRCSNFIDDQQGQIIITGVVESITDQYVRSKCQMAFRSRAFRGRDKGAVEREIVKNSRSGTR